MAKVYSARGIVIKHTKLGETDTIVTLIDSEGQQIKGVAKGLRKPGNKIGGRLQLFNEVDLMLHKGRNLDIISETKMLGSNMGIQAEVERVAGASVIAEMLEKLSRDGASVGSRTYEMTRSALAWIGDMDKDRASIIVSAFLMKAMAMQGFAPSINECALCGAVLEDPVFFSVGHGGAMCDACVQELGIRGDQKPQLIKWVGALTYLTFSELAGLERFPSSELLEISRAWIAEHADIHLKSISFLKTLL